MLRGGVLDMKAIIMLRFLAWNIIPHWMDHCSRAPWSLYRETWSSGSRISWYTKQSSAKRWHWVDGCSTDEWLLMYKRKRSGPHIVPCGKPEVTSGLIENWPSVTTLSVHHHRNYSIHVRMLPLIPYSLSLPIHFIMLDLIIGLA